MNFVFEFKRVITEKAIRSKMAVKWFCGEHQEWFDPKKNVCSGCDIHTLKPSRHTYFGIDFSKEVAKMEEESARIQEEERRARLLSNYPGAITIPWGP